jgi:hypothetical protein
VPEAIQQATRRLSAIDDEIHRIWGEFPELRKKARRCAWIDRSPAHRLHPSGSRTLMVRHRLH